MLRQAPILNSQSQHAVLMCPTLNVYVKLSSVIFRANHICLFLQWKLRVDRPQKMDQGTVSCLSIIRFPCLYKIEKLV